MIQDFLTIMLLALCTGALGVFFQECLEPGMIFGRYGKWLHATYRLSWRRKDRWRRLLVQPLGNCVFCNTSWIYIIAHFIGLGWGKAAFVLLGLGLNYVFVKIFNKL